MPNIVATRRNIFYDRQTISVTDFPNAPQFKFPFDATRVLIDARNRSDDAVIVKFSFLNPELDGELFCEDGPLAFDELKEARMWLKVDTGSADVRVWAWRL